MNKYITQEPETLQQVLEKANNDIKLLNDLNKYRSSIDVKDFLQPNKDEADKKLNAFDLNGFFSTKKPA